jgi:signal transduction histidine kinase
MSNKRRIITWYIRYQLKSILLFSGCLIIFLTVFALYSIRLEAVGYALVLSILFSLIVTIIDFIRFYNKHIELEYIRNHCETSIEGLPTSTNLIDVDYQNIIKNLFDNKNNLALKFDLLQIDMIDYYTLWAHQIKTPIAAIRLLLQSESHELTSELMIQLSTVEQYIEMVLGYLRIESPSSDLNFQMYNVSDIVKQGIRKYSNFFIRKNIKLEFQESECFVLTDEKWFLFVFEQVLFNALKYTHHGKISITIDSQNKFLYIKDSGIGIAEEDLPRIFEKGFTGYNGRMDKKATGVGLYLSKKILNKLSHRIEITSKVGVGTMVKFDLSFEENLMD